MITTYRFLTVILPILAFIVITVGAHVRLTHAGLGCPDWPGCYGQFVVTQDDASLAERAHEYQQGPVEVGKAWREMFHRYIAAGLGFGIVILFFCSLRNRSPVKQTTLLASLVLLVMFQGALGMWTVTLLLKPLVVTAHLLGGLATLSLLWWHLLSRRYPKFETQADAIPLMNTLMLVLIGQIFLGGWTSTNYAALACTDFPTCHGVFWPEMDIKEAFVLWRGLGVDYEFGVLDTPARTAIHFAHRFWALITAVSLGAAAIYAVTAGPVSVKRAGWCIIVALGAQLSLGVGNVLLGLPLPVAVAHNGGAALLLLAVLTLKYFNNYKVL